MPTDWAGVVGSEPCCDAGRADGVFARKAYLNLDGTALTREGAVTFQTDTAAFLWIVYAVLHLEELVEEGFGHLENCVLGVWGVDLLVCECRVLMMSEIGATVRIESDVVRSR